MDNLSTAVTLLADPAVLGVILAASIFGLFVGAIPGLSATMATALLVPLTFFMDPLPAIAAIVSAVAMAISAGDIPGAMLRIPGTPASAAYVDDAYQMTLRGHAEKALGIGLVASVIGGLVGAIILTTGARLLAEFSFNFSTVEYFWLATLGLSSSVIISRSAPVKGLDALLIGLFISTIRILPGAGSDIAAWVSYAMAKKFSRTPEKFGTGHPEGLVAAGAANNAALSGVWIPALVFGIPGDSVTAIAIGVLFMKGITPGPMVFIEQAGLTYAIFLTFFLANILLIFLGYFAIRGARFVVRTPA